MSERPWYLIDNAAQIPSPAVLVYPDRIARNLDRMIELAGGPQHLRPHVKTHKLPQVVAMKRAAGIRKFKVATIAEAEMTATAGGEDILLAHQPLGPNVARLLTLMERFPGSRFSTIVDDLQALQALGRAALAAGRVLPVMIDLDVGMHRTGIAPDDAAFELYRTLCATAGLSPAGLHAYDGHLHIADEQALRQAAHDAFLPVWALRTRLQAAGLSVPLVVASGTPTFALLAREPGVEVGAGTTVLWDRREQAMCASHQMLNAAVLLTRVISRPTPDRLTLDIGHKAVASEMPHPRVTLFGLEDAEFVGHSEEHLMVRTPRAAEYRVGDVLYGLPFHVCPTMALHSEVWAVRDGQAVEIWPVTARARRITV